MCAEKQEKPNQERGRRTQEHFEQVTSPDRQVETEQQVRESQ